MSRYSTSARFDPDRVLAHPSAPHCSILFSQTHHPTLAPFDNQGYPFGEPREASPRVRGMSRAAFVGDEMTHGGQKGFGMTKHGRSGHATRSPRFRFLQKLEAQKNDRKDRSRIKDPKQSVEELFHPGSQHEPDELSLDELGGRHIRKFGGLCSVRERS
jgi:hypothetical protein